MPGKKIAVALLLLLTIAPNITFSEIDTDTYSWGGISIGRLVSKYSGWDSNSKSESDDWLSTSLYEHLIEENKMKPSDAEKIVGGSDGQSGVHLELFRAYRDQANAFENLKPYITIGDEAPQYIDDVVSLVEGSNLVVKDEQGLELLKQYADAQKKRLDILNRIFDQYGYDQPNENRASLNQKNKALQDLLESNTLKPGDSANFDTSLLGQITGLNESVNSTVTDGKTGQQVYTSNKIKCGVTSGDELMGCLGIVLYNILLKGGAWLLSVAGMLFNVSLNFTLNIGELFVEGSGMGLGGSSGAVYRGWATVRDFINITFIFVLLYVSIQTILQSDKYSAKKMVKNIVIAALILNFSLFFTKAIIDLSNILALQFYSRILVAADDAGGTRNEIDGGISSAISNTLGMQTIWSTGNQSADPNRSNVSVDQFANFLKIGPYELVTVSLFGGVFMLVLALVFLIALISFVMRTIVLLFLLVTSPLGFIGSAIPGFGGVAKQWRDRLTNNVVYAPAYMAILYVICQMIFSSAGRGITGGGGFRGVITGDNQKGSVGVIFWFVLVTGLLLTGQAAARKFADAFGSGITNATDKFFKGGAKKLGKKGLGLAGKGGMAAAGGLGAAAGFGLRRLVTRTPLGGAVRALGGKKLFDKLAATDVERAKEKAKNLRARSGESAEDFARRKNEMVARAQVRQAYGLGFDENDLEFEVDSSGNRTGKIKGIKTDDATKAKVARMEMDNNRKWFGRKEAKAKLDAFKKAFGSSALADKEAEEKELADKLKAHNSSLPSAPSAFDGTSYRDEIERIQQENDDLFNNSKFLARLHAGDADALALTRRVKNELKAAEDALKRASDEHYAKQIKAQADHAAMADKFEAELKKLRRSIKEQKEREAKEESKKK